MILGISGSPRANSVTANAVKYMLSKFEGEHEVKYISLAGKRINGCISCLGCSHDNVCVIKDDFTEIAEAMKNAEAIIIGVPNYYSMPNAISHAMLERCFSFRHRSEFTLKDKVAVIFSTGYATEGTDNPVLNSIDHFMKMNKINVASKFLVGAYAQCYTCDYGRTCADGNVVKNNGYVDVVTPDMLPATFDKQVESIRKCDEAVESIKKIISKK